MRLCLVPENYFSKYNASLVQDDHGYFQILMLVICQILYISKDVVFLLFEIHLSNEMNQTYIKSF